MYFKEDKGFMVEGTKVVELKLNLKQLCSVFMNNSR